MSERASHRDASPLVKWRVNEVVLMARGRVKH